MLKRELYNMEFHRISLIISVSLNSLTSNLRKKKKKEKVIFTIDSQLANNTHNDIEAKKQCYIIR